jgi:hypothetical protein
LSATQVMITPHSRGAKIIESTPEKIAARKIIVYKTLIDPTVIKLATEKIKDRLFLKFGFLRPNPEQIQQVSFEKDYEAFVVIDGRYTIDYYRRRIYPIKVDEKAQEVILFEQKFKPETSNEPPGKVVRIEGEERLVSQAKAYLVLSADGREVSPKRIPSAPSEEQSKKLLAEIESTKKLEILPNEEIDIIRNKIVKRPPEIKRIVYELFEVTDRAVIYTPIYKVKFQNIKTGELKTVKFDGVTAKLLT